MVAEPASVRLVVEARPCDVSKKNGAVESSPPIARSRAVDVGEMTPDTTFHCEATTEPSFVIVILPAPFWIEIPVPAVSVASVGAPLPSPIRS